MHKKDLVLSRESVTFDREIEVLKLKQRTLSLMFNESLVLVENYIAGAVSVSPLLGAKEIKDLWEWWSLVSTEYYDD